MVDMTVQTAKKKYPASRMHEKPKWQICHEIRDAFERVEMAYRSYDRDKETLLDEAMKTENPDQHITDRIEALNETVSDVLYDVYPKIKKLYQDLGLVNDDDDEDKAGCQ